MTIAVGLAAFAAAAVIPSPVPRAAWFQVAMTATHNAERASAGVPAMRWDPALASDAQQYAQQLARLGAIEHSPPQARPGQGENLWMGTTGAWQPGQMVRDWASEKRLFAAGSFPAVSRSGSWHDVGHYTQIIWPETERFGCALTRAKGWDYLVCRYWPAGNVMGQRVPR